MPWELISNSISPQPAAPPAFFGAKDNQPLVIKTNNLERMRVAADGRVSVGFGGAIING